MKQHDNSGHLTADTLLAEISAQQVLINEVEAQCNAEMAAVKNKYSLILIARITGRDLAAQSLIALMRQEKAVLFDGTDVVNLPHGSLIHSLVDKLTIPKTALDECKAQGFNDVIKIVESLDRDAIGQWPDAKLVLIGAQRKTKEDFSYDLSRAAALRG